MNEFFSWSMLATFAGSALAVGVMTQLLKNVKQLKRLPTQWLSYFLSVVVLALATAATQWPAAWQTWALIPLNAVLVGMASNGVFAAAKRVKNKKNTE